MAPLSWYNSNVHDWDFGSYNCHNLSNIYVFKANNKDIEKTCQMLFWLWTYICPSGNLNIHTMLILKFRQQSVHLKQTDQLRKFDIYNSKRFFFQNTYNQDIEKYAKTNYILLY